MPMSGKGLAMALLLEPDYLFDVASKESDSNKVKKRRQVHNRNVKRRWAYGGKRKKGICSSASKKSKGCNGGTI